LYKIVSSPLKNLTKLCDLDETTRIVTFLFSVQRVPSKRMHLMIAPTSLACDRGAQREQFQIFSARWDANRHAILGFSLVG